MYLASAPEEEGNPYGVKMLWNADWHQEDSSMRVQALMLLLAQIAADRAQSKPMHRAQLEKASQRLGVTWQIRRSEG